MSRNLAGYASLNHASMSAMKVIGDNVKQWKDGTGPSGLALEPKIKIQRDVASLKGEGPRQLQEKGTVLSLKMNHHPRTDDD